MRRISLIAAALCCPVAVTSSAAGQETLIGVVGRDFVMLGADSSSSSSVALTSSNLDKIRVLSDPFPTGRAHHDDWKGLAESWTQQTIAAAAAGASADCDRLLDILAAHCTLREYETGVGCDVETVYDGSTIGTGKNENHGERGSNSIDASAPSGLDAEAVAYLARSVISQSLRSRDRLSLCLLIAGMVKTDTNFCLANGEASDKDTSHSERLRRQVEAATSTVLATGTEVEPSASKEPIAMSRRQHLVPKMFWLDEYGSIQQLQYGAHGYASNFVLSILDRGYRPNLSREEATDLIKDCFQQLRTRYIINSPNPPRIKCISSDGCELVQ